MDKYLSPNEPTQMEHIHRVAMIAGSKLGGQKRRSGRVVGRGLLPNENDHDTARPPTFILMFVMFVIS